MIKSGTKVVTMVAPQRQSLEFTPLDGDHSGYHRLYFYRIEKTRGYRIFRNPLFLLVPGARIELAQPSGPRDFKSLASTSSATQAYLSYLFN